MASDNFFRNMVMLLGVVATVAMGLWNKIMDCWFPHYLDFYFLIIWIQNLHFHIG